MNDHLNLLHALLSQPTVPFHEDAVSEQVRLWAAERDIEFLLDGSRNVLLRCRRGQASTHWAYEAHMDHPGFLALSQAGRRLEADFLGSVAAGYFPGSRVRFFAPGGEQAGTVQTVSRIQGSEWPRCEIEMDGPAAIPPGSLGMWDLPAIAVEGDVLSSRACDDVVGCAAALAALDAIARSSGAVDVAVMLTRAEEVGGMGAMAAGDARVLPMDTLVVGIETSKAQPGAALGEGVVVRVGDRARTFEPVLTSAVSEAAAELASRDKEFRYVRHLMPGGTCESTIWCLWGYRATGVCLPLGNYHNMGDDGTIRSEQVNLRDFDCTVKLLAALPFQTLTPDQREQDLLRRWRELMDRRGKYL